MTIQVRESDTREMVEDLNKLVSGEVRFDKMSRVLYSTDASIYEIEPIGVVIPRTPEDVIAVVETANKYGVSVLPRGGGTSLGGQTVGHSIVMDFSKYMHNVIEVNEEERWVRTQPGIVLDVLNHQLRDRGRAGPFHLEPGKCGRRAWQQLLRGALDNVGQDRG